MMRYFRSIHDVPSVPDLVHSALQHKASPRAHRQLGEGKTLGLLFFNPSLRTRVSTQKAAANLGMDCIVINAAQDAWTLEMADGTVMDGGSSEHIREAAAVLGEYCDIIGVRSFPSLADRQSDYEDSVIEKVARFSGRPLLSLESATRHPLQSLADLITIQELQQVPRPKVVLTWAPHPRALPQAVPNSFAEWMNAADVDFVITHPEGYELADEFVGTATVTHNQDEALSGAHFVYAKNWSSYTHYGKILSRDASWMITNKKMALTDNGKFMHCLPVRRNVIVADEVLDSPSSVVIREAGNRVWSAQAVLSQMLSSL